SSWKKLLCQSGICTGCLKTIVRQPLKMYLVFHLDYIFSSCSQSLSISSKTRSISSHEYMVAPAASGCPPPPYFLASSLIAGPLERKRRRISPSSSTKNTQALIPATLPKVLTSCDACEGSALYFSSSFSSSTTEAAPFSDILKFSKM